MRLIAPYLAIAALASGCTKDKPAESSPRAVDPVGAPTPAEPTPARPSIDAAEAVDAKPEASSPWQITMQGVGPLHGRMTRAELLAVPGLVIKDEWEDEDRFLGRHMQGWIGSEHELNVLFEGDLVRHIQVRGRTPRLAPTADGWSAGVGTTAEELQQRYGAPTSYDEALDGAPNCAQFEGVEEAAFCFRTDLTTWKKVRKQNLPVGFLMVH